LGCLAVGRSQGQLCGCGTGPGCCAIAAARPDLDDAINAPGGILEELPGNIEGQEHLDAFRDELEEEEEDALNMELEHLDFAILAEEFSRALTRQEAEWIRAEALQAKMLFWGRPVRPYLTPGASVTRVDDISRARQEHVIAYKELGMRQLADGTVAVVMLAADLEGCFADDHYRGCMDLGLVSGKSLFQLYFERLIRLKRLVARHQQLRGGSKASRTDVHVAVYVMTNHLNHDTVVSYVKGHGCFGIPPSDVTFFTSESKPLSDASGRLLLGSPSSLVQAPVGNGAFFEATMEAGVLADFKCRSAGALCVCTVENLLCKVGDPALIGHSEYLKADSGIKLAYRSDVITPLDLFMSRSRTRQVHPTHGAHGGAVGEVDSGMVASVVGYDEAPARHLHETVDGGELRFCHLDLRQYFIHTSRLHLLHTAVTKRGFHVRREVVTTLHPETGDDLELNAFRLELRFSDCMSAPGMVAALEVTGEEAFVVAPEGALDFASGINKMSTVHQDWTKAAGATFENNMLAMASIDMACEISPLLSYEGEDLQGLFAGPVKLPVFIAGPTEEPNMEAEFGRLRVAYSQQYLGEDSEVAKVEQSHLFHTGATEFPWNTNDSRKNAAVAAGVQGSARDSARSAAFEAAEPDECLASQAATEESSTEEVVAAPEQALGASALGGSALEASAVEEEEEAAREAERKREERRKKKKAEVKQSPFGWDELKMAVSDWDHTYWPSGKKGKRTAAEKVKLGASRNGKSRSRLSGSAVKLPKAAIEG